MERLWLSMVWVRIPDLLFLWPGKFLGASLDIYDSSICLVVAFVLNGAVSEDLVK